MASQSTGRRAPSSELLVDPTQEELDASVTRGLAAADAMRSISAHPLRADALDAATLSAIVEAVAAHDAVLAAHDQDQGASSGGCASAARSLGGARDESPPRPASILGETVEVIVRVGSDLAGLRNNERAALQLELARRSAEEQWFGRANEWKAEAMQLLLRALGARLDADMQTQIEATGMNVGKLKELRRAMLRYLGMDDLLSCAEACRVFTQWSRSIVRELKFRYDVSDADVAQIAARYPNLRVVDLSGCDRITDVCIVALAGSCPQLKRVNLGAGGCKVFTNVSIVALARGCPQLESVILKGCKLITDVSIVALARGCRQLKRVDLAHCTLLTDISITALAGNCAQLESVNLWSCQLITDVSMTALAGNCRQLQSLNLSNCWLITDVSVTALAKWCPLLKSVNLVRCFLITDISVTALARSCPQLESVTLNWCTLVTDASVVALAENCPRLKSVGLARCKLITDVSIVALARGCPQLKRVCLLGCTLITDVSIVALARGCPQLKSVGLQSCELITDVSIVALTKCCPLLKHVNLCNCMLLTDASPLLALAALAGSCTGLEHMSFYGCTLVTDASVAALNAALERGVSRRFALILERRAQEKRSSPAQ